MANTNFTVTLTAAEKKALEYVAYSAQDWIDNAPFKVSLDKGLWQAVEEFLDRNKHTWVLHEHHTNQNGLTILKRKNGTYEL